MKNRMKLVISAALLQAALLLSGCSAAKDSAAAAEKAAAAGDLDRAEVLFNQAIAQEDDQPLYYAQLGMVCVMQGEYEEAQSCFDTALQMDGGCTAALRGQGICKLRQGDAAGAVSSFSEALAGLRNQKSGTAQDLLAWRAEASREAGELSSAEADCETLIAAGYHVTDMTLLRGDLALADGDLSSALETWQKALPEDSGKSKTKNAASVEAERARVWLHMLQELSDSGADGASDAAAQILQEAQDSSPQTAEGLCGKGKILLQARDTDGAFACFEQSYNDGNADAGTYLAACYRKRGTQADYEEACRIYQTLLLNDPDNAQIYAEYAAAKIEQEDYTGAQILITQGKETADTDELCTLLWNEAVCAERQRDYEEAADLLRQILEKSPEDSEAAEELSYLESRM